MSTGLVDWLGMNCDNSWPNPPTQLGDSRFGVTLFLFLGWIGVDIYGPISKCVGSELSPFLLFDLPTGPIALHANPNWTWPFS